MKTYVKPTLFDTDKLKLWRTAFENIQLMLERRDNYIFECIEHESILTFTNPENKKILLFFHYCDKMGIDTLRNLIQFAEYEGIRNIIIILQNTWSTNCKKVIENLMHYDIEVFDLDEFQYDITTLYYFVPHEKLTKEDEIATIRQSYGTSIPVILKSDPIAKYYKFDRGDIVKVWRNDFDQPSISYRIVR